MNKHTLIIEATLRTVGPLSIRLPVAEGAAENRWANFPVLTRGLDDEGNPLQTGYLPATTVRGFLRRAIVTDAMERAAAEGRPYTLQRAYADLIGQDAASEKSEDVDLVKLAAQRDAEPVADLFGLGMTLKSRLFVSHFLPRVNVLPEVTSGVRKDLEDTEGVLDALSAADRDLYLGRSAANSERAAAAAVVTDLRRKLKKAERAGEDTADLAAALKAAEERVAGFEDRMGEMKNSSRTLTSYFALPAGLDLLGRLVIERARERDLPMIELALDALSRRPLLGAQVARGCGEVAGSFDVLRDGVLIRRISVGGWKPAQMTEFAAAA